MSSTPPTGSLLKSAFNRLDMSSLKAPLMLSFINQFVTSGGNFLVGIYLARTLPLEGFGLYGIGFGICMLYVGVGNAVILTQMLVNMADRAGDEKEAFAARMLCAVLLMGALFLLLSAVAAFCAVLIRPDYARFLVAIAAIALASALFLCNEFFVSYAYLKRRESLALAVNATTMLVLFGGLLIERLAGMTLTAPNVLLLYALGAATGSCAGYLASPLTLRRHARNLLPEFIESWRHGRWALGGVTVTWIQSQAYTYVLAIFLGPAGVGLANAAKIFISPFSFLLPAINKVAIPRLAELRRFDPEKMLRVSAQLTTGITLLAVLYSLLLLSSLDFVSRQVLGRTDPRIASLAWIWCLVLVFQMMRSGGGVLLQVQRKFRVLALINIPSALAAIAVAVLLIRSFGAVGAIWGMVAGEVVLAIFIWKEIRNDRSHR